MADRALDGDFQNERLAPVTYAETPLSPIQFHQLRDLETTVEASLSRKRIEWQHEQEWRVLTGAGGPKHYRDDALTRIFLGPRTSDAHAERLCELFKDRPTEILRGSIHGYRLQFETIKLATPFQACARVGAGKLDLGEIIYDRAELEGFLSVPFGRLEELLRETLARPNAEAVVGCDLSGNHQKRAIYVWTTYRLRSGREVWDRRYFDHELKPFVELA